MKAFSVSPEAISPGIPTMPLADIVPGLEGRGVMMRRPDECGRDPEVLFVRLDAGNAPAMEGDHVQTADLVGTAGSHPSGGFNTILSGGQEPASADRLLWIDAGGDFRAELGAFDARGTSEQIPIKTRLYSGDSGRGLGMRGMHVLRDWHSVLLHRKYGRNGSRRTVVVNAGGSLVRVAQNELDELIPSYKDERRIKAAKRDLVKCVNPEIVAAVLRELDKTLRWTVHSAAVAIARRRVGLAGEDV